jgi:mRNA interferase MazF
MEEYFKDFDKWNEIAKTVDLNNKNRKVFFREQEIWWCSVGVNIGSEIDGKNDLFERPVLIIRKINKDLLLVAPLTSKIKKDDFRILTSCDGIDSQILLFQCRVISVQRLIKRIGFVKMRIYYSSIIELVKMILGR